uniref:Copper transport protein n=1 Tax=Caenorhabditis japonica TaxID=281687 RepID=A0A8R1IAP0_CAEJA
KNNEFSQAIKSFRYFIAVWNNQKRQQRQAEASITNPANSGVDSISEDSIHIAPLVQLSGFTKKLFTSYRLAQGALYGLQALLAYALMLIVMTYNMNLILSIVVGEAVGYFLFTGDPFVDHQLTDCC